MYFAYAMWILACILSLQTAGQIGHVTKVYMTSCVQVYVQGRGWVFYPLCLEPAPGKTAAPYTPDPKSKMTHL